MAGVTSDFMSFSIVFVVVFSFFPFSFVFFQNEPQNAVEFCLKRAWALR